MDSAFEIFGWMSGVLFASCYIPQIIRTYRLGTVDDLSIWMFVFNAAAYICGLLYGIYLDKYALMFNYAAGLILTTVIILQWAVKRDPRKDEIRKIVSKEIKIIKKQIREKP